MRREHKSHVVIISIMLLVILAIFAFVLFHNPIGVYNPGITGSLPPAGIMYSASYGLPETASPVYPLQTEVQILIAFLIILFFLVILHFALKIFRGFRKHHHSQ